MDILIGRGIPDSLVATDATDGIPVIRAKTTCGLRYSHDCYHVAWIHLPGGGAVEFELRHTLLPESLRERLEKGPIPCRFVPAQERETCACASIHRNAESHLKDVADCPICGTGGAGSCCMRLCCRNDEDGRCLLCGKPIPERELAALRARRWTSRFRVGDRWVYSRKINGEADGTRTVTILEKRRRPPNAPADLPGEWLLVEETLADREAFRRFWYLDGRTFAVTDEAGALLTRIPLSTLIPDQKASVLYEGRQYNGTVNREILQIGNTLRIGCGISEEHESLLFHKNLGLVCHRDHRMRTTLEFVLVNHPSLENDVEELTGTLRTFDGGVAIGGEADPSGFILETPGPLSLCGDNPLLPRPGRLYVSGDVPASLIGKEVRVRGVLSLLRVGGVETPAREFLQIEAKEMHPQE